MSDVRAPGTVVELSPAQEEHAENISGVPPADFNERVQEMSALMRLAYGVVGIDPEKEIGELAANPKFRRLRDLFLMGAWAYSQSQHDGRGEHTLAFIQRAKLIARWCARPLRDRQTARELLESQAAELARVIAERMFRGDEFLLVISNSGAGGFTTWISSMERNSSIAVLGGLLETLKADQAKRS